MDLPLNQTSFQDYITKNKFENTERRQKPILKKKLKGSNNIAGRNNSGRITANHRGGGHKRKYRQINFQRTNDSEGITCSIEYDPNRNTKISAIYDSKNREFFYIISPKKNKIGDLVFSGPTCQKPHNGSTLLIRRLLIGSYIHCIAPNLKKMAQISRAAGTYSKIKEKTMSKATLELSSGEHRSVPIECFATLGIISNELVFLEKKYKAGQSRWLNKRPSVRGVAMNPIDHPHGGGEGKKSGKNRTPWGKNNLRGKTSNSKNRYTIKSRNE